MASKVASARSTEPCWPLFGFHSGCTESYHHAFTRGFFLSKRSPGLLLGGGVGIDMLGGRATRMQAGRPIRGNRTLYREKVIMA